MFSSNAAAKPTAAPANLPSPSSARDEDEGDNSTPNENSSTKSSIFTPTHINHAELAEMLGALNLGTAHRTLLDTLLGNVASIPPQ
jgi:hypothetical protein